MRFPMRVLCSLLDRIPDSRARGARQRDTGRTSRGLCRGRSPQRAFVARWVGRYQAEPLTGSPLGGKGNRPMKVQSAANASLASAVLLVLLAAGVQLAARQAGLDHGGKYSQTDIAYGAQLYAGQCISCHGPNGDSINGVDLRSGRFRNAGTDQAPRNLITNGIPRTGMPGLTLGDGEMAGIVADLRNNG